LCKLRAINSWVDLARTEGATRNDHITKPLFRGPSAPAHQTPEPQRSLLELYVR
jgi:hypothetical protein